MSKILVEADEFGDIVIAFLFDKLLHDEILADNDRFDIIAGMLDMKGMKPFLFKAYRDMDSQTRIMYKKIKDVFDYTASSNAIIEIKAKKERKEKEEEKPESLTKKVLKKVIGKVLAGEELSVEDKEYLREELDYDGTL